MQAYDNEKGCGESLHLPLQPLGPEPWNALWSHLVVQQMVVTETQSGSFSTHLIPSG